MKTINKLLVILFPLAILFLACGVKTEESEQKEVLEGIPFIPLP